MLEPQLLIFGSSLILLILFSSLYQSIIMLLLTLEALTLISLMLFTFLAPLPSLVIPLLILSLAACETSLGLSILSQMGRYSGTDKMASLFTP